MRGLELVLLAGIYSSPHAFVTSVKMHPILVNFTAALIPTSVASDILARWAKSETLRSTGWWTMLYATVITPLTAAAGWLFWMPDDNGDRGMMIHKWLGTALTVALFGLFAWRLKLRRKNEWASTAYLGLGIIFVLAVIAQGYLGGEKVFNG